MTESEQRMINFLALADALKVIKRTCDSHFPTCTECPMNRIENDKGQTINLCVVEWSPLTWEEIRTVNGSRKDKT